MKISKNQKYIISKARLKKQILKHTNENLFISSDLGIPQLKKYLSNKGDRINTPDDKGETILSYSIIRNKTEVSKYIISNFNNINLNYYDKNGKSYLHKAVLMKNYEMMTELIDKGINVNCQDNNGNTPLHLATIQGDPRAIKILVYGHGRVNMVNSKGETPMILARNNGNLRCINAILKKKKVLQIKKIINRVLKVNLYGKNWEYQNMIIIINLCGVGQKLIILLILMVQKKLHIEPVLMLEIN